MYQKDGTCLNLNKTISGTRITVKTEDNITVVQQSLGMIKVSGMQKKGKMHPREFKIPQNSSDVRRVVKIIVKIIVCHVL